MFLRARDETDILANIASSSAIFSRKEGKKELSKTMMAVAGLAMAVAVTGCGGSPKGVAEGFVDALIHRDTERALKYVETDKESPGDLAEWREILDEAGKDINNGNHDNLKAEAFCVVIVRHANGVRYYEKTEMRVNGDMYYEKSEERRVKADKEYTHETATVKVKYKEDMGLKPNGLEVYLAKIDGSWKVTDFGEISLDWTIRARD